MRYFMPLMLLALVGAGCGPPTVGLDELGMRIVKLPNGQQIRAEAEIDPTDMQKGMMFRDSLPRGRGMLFIHDKPGLYPYWMYQVRIPLDMLWMDASHRIVEVAADTPPGKTKARHCDEYGGAQVG